MDFVLSLYRWKKAATFINHERDTHNFRFCHNLINQQQTVSRYLMYEKKSSQVFTKMIAY